VKKLARWLALISILAIVLTSGPGLMASPPDDVPGVGRGRDPDKMHGWGFGHFKDVEKGHWAFRAITMMEIKKVFGGYGDGRFGPNDPVTRIQLVCLALRIMGLEDEAMAAGAEAARTQLRGAFDDYLTVPGWEGAQECLAYAYENGYLLGLCHQEQNRFRPNDPATRLEVVMTLLEAMGRGDEAAAMAGAPIDAPDADTVPDWAHGCVALAIEMGLLRGDEEGCLNLYSNVRRCETAMFLARVDDRVESPADRSVIKGELVSVTTGDSPTITVLTKVCELEDYEEAVEAEDGDEDSGDEEGDEGTESEGAPGDEGAESEDDGDEGDDRDVTLVERTYSVSPDALIYVRGEPASLEDLAPGDQVQIRLSDTDEVVFIDAHVERVEVSGCVVSTELAEDGETLLSVTIEVGAYEDDEPEGDEDEGDETEGAQGDDEGGEEETAYEPGTEVTFAVAHDAEIWFRGDHDSDALPLPGDYVELKIVHEEVVILVIDERCEEKGELEGVVVSVGEADVTFTVTEVEWEEGDILLPRGSRRCGPACRGR